MEIVIIRGCSKSLTQNRLPPFRCSLDKKLRLDDSNLLAGVKVRFCCYGILRSVWMVVTTDVSVQPVGPIIQGSSSLGLTDIQRWVTSQKREDMEAQLNFPPYKHSLFFCAIRTACSLIIDISANIMYLIKYSLWHKHVSITNLMHRFFIP